MRSPEITAWTSQQACRTSPSCYCRSLRIRMDSALNRPVEDWGKLLGDVAAVTAMLDRILHHGHVLKCGPRSWRTKTAVATAGGNQ
jgi:hypothetical protein